jgi:hypothetical protein
MTALKIERWWPYLASIAVFLVWWFLFDKTFPKTVDGLMAASGTVSVVLVGFLGTAKAIVLSISSSAVFQRLKASGYHHVLFQYLFESLTAGVILLIVSLIGFFLPEDHPQRWFEIVWVLSCSATIFLYIRTTSILFKLVRQA